MKLFRLTALLLVFICLLAIFPFPQAQALSHADLFDLIAAQYDAYAASIYQANAADDTLDQLLNHALYGKSKTLHMGPSDPVTACAFGSAMFREGIIQTLAHGIESLHDNQTDKALMALSANWYDNSSSYAVSDLWFNTTADFEDDMTRHLLISAKKPASQNRNDSALVLVVGSSRSRIWIDRDPANPNRYHVRVTFFDRFDFNKSLTSAMKEFNGSLGTILNILGPLMGFKSFDWEATTEFDLELPQLCSHQKGNYRWEDYQGTLTSVSDEGLTKNPLLIHTATISGTETKANYYELTDPIQLLHTDPWVMEFRYNSSHILHIHPQKVSYISHPYLWMGSNRFYAGQALPNDWEEGIASGKARYHYGIQTNDYPADQWHTYRIENRIASDGSNMLWLLIDGEEVGPLDNYYIQQKDGRFADQNTKSDWVSGVDFTVRYIGNSSYPLRGKLDYFAVWQNADPLTVQSTTASCTEAGSLEETCALCGITSLRQGEAPLGHEPQTVPGVSATCEAAGSTEAVLCARCSETLTAAQTIPALGHSPETIPGKEPLCDEEGRTGGSICSVCGKILTAQTAIPALGHQYENGLCTACGQTDPTLLPGDANLDGKADYQDALAVLQMSIDLKPILPIHLLLCDLDGNGQLTYNDALLILRTSIGLR